MAQKWLNPAPLVAGRAQGRLEWATFDTPLVAQSAAIGKTDRSQPTSGEAAPAPSRTLSLPAKKPLKVKALEARVDVSPGDLAPQHRASPPRGGGFVAFAQALLEATAAVSPAPGATRQLRLALAVTEAAPQATPAFVSMALRRLAEASTDPELKRVAEELRKAVHNAATHARLIRFKAMWESALAGIEARALPVLPLQAIPIPSPPTAPAAATPLQREARMILDPYEVASMVGDATADCFLEAFIAPYGSLKGVNIDGRLIDALHIVGRPLSEPDGASDEEWTPPLEAQAAFLASELCAVTREGALRGLWRLRLLLKERLAARKRERALAVMVAARLVEDEAGGGGKRRGRRAVRDEPS